MTEVTKSTDPLLELEDVRVRLGPLLPRVDAYAAAQRVTRAEGIRQLVELSLLDWEQEEKERAS